MVQEPDFLDQFDQRDDDQMFWERHNRSLQREQEIQRLRGERRLTDGGNGNNQWAIRSVFQIVVSLFLLMLTGAATLLWTRIDKVDTIQQSRGERVRALELQVDQLKQDRSQDRAELEWMKRQLYSMPPVLLPHERPR